MDLQAWRKRHHSRALGSSKFLKRFFIYTYDLHIYMYCEARHGADTWMIADDVPLPSRSIVNDL